MGVPSASKPSPRHWRSLATPSKTCTNPTSCNRVSWAEHRAVELRPRRLFPTWGSSRARARARVRSSRTSVLAPAPVPVPEAAQPGQPLTPLFCRSCDLVSALGAPGGHGTRGAVRAETHVVRVHLVFAVVEAVDLFLGADA